MVFVCATVAAMSASQVVPAFLTVTAYFAGVVLYVKTMIRERGNTGYYRASVAYHLVIFGIAAWSSPPIAILFAMLLARAYVLPQRRMTPKHVGIIEITASVLLVIALTAF